MEYTTFLPVFISCPLCGQPHETTQEVAQCWKPELWFAENTENVQGGK